MGRFTALIVRSFTILLRSWKNLVIDIGSVLAIFVILTLNPLQYRNAALPNGVARTSDGLLPDNWPRPTFPQNMLGYYPVTEETSRLANFIVIKLGLEAIIGFSSPEEMKRNFRAENLFAGIEFLEPTKLDKKLSFLIRYPSKFRTVNDLEVDGPYELYWETLHSGVLVKDQSKKTVQPDLYLAEGILALQQALITTWERNLGDGSGMMDNPPTIDRFTLRAFEHYNSPKFSRMPFYDFLIFFSFFLPFCNLVWIFGREIELNMAFHHWKIGCSFYIYWLINYIAALSYLLMLDFIVLLVLRIKWIPILETYDNVKYVDLILLFLIYNTSLILLAILVGTITLQARKAVLLGACWWVSNYAVFAVISTSVNIEFTPFNFLSAVILPANMLPSDFFWLKYFEEQREQFYLIMTPILGNIVLTLIILVILTPFRPGKYLYCDSLKYYLLPCLARRRNVTMQDMMRLHYVDKNQFEYNSPNKALALVVRNVSTFRHIVNEGSVPSLKNVSFRLYVGEISVLVGPKQSGKTTLCRVVAGWQVPDLGSVYYGEVDILTDWKKVNKISDVLFRYSPLYDQLTVNEHLCYVIRLKAGTSDHDQLRKEREKWEYYLESFINDDSMKIRKLDHEKRRLLCLCFALSCKQTLVILDEATADLNVRNRHIYWEILKNEKENRAILVTTTSFAEAEAIGDSIGLIENGILSAMGSPFFLKSSFGDGDKLIIYKTPNADVTKINYILKKYFPRIVAENDVGETVLYLLPTGTRKIYERALINLEKNAVSLGIVNIKLLSADVKDVAKKISKEITFIQYQPIITEDFRIENQYKYVAPKYICCAQIKAICFKKIMEVKMMVYGWFLFIVFIIFLVFIMWMLKYSNKGTQSLIPRQGSDYMKQVPSFLQYEKCGFVQVMWTHSNHFALSCGRGEFGTALKKPFLSKQIVGAVERYRNEYFVWFNQRRFHSAILMVELYHNFFLSAKYDQSYRIEVTVESVGDLPARVLLSREFGYQNSQGFSVPIALGIIMPIFTSFFILTLYRERWGNFLDLLEINGISWDHYWFTSYFFDFSLYAACAFLFFLGYAYMNSLGNRIDFQVVSLIVTIIYGASIIPIIYFISFFKFSSEKTAYLSILLMQFCAGPFLFFVYLLVFNSSVIIYRLALILPPFSLVDGLYKCAVCSSTNVCSMSGLLFHFDHVNVLINITYMSATMILTTFGLYLLVDYKQTAKFRTPKHIREYRSVIDLHGDANVSHIKQKVADLSKRECENHLVCVDQLENKLGHERKLHTISFLLEQSEVLCIRGPRFSCKSRIGKQLVGLEDHQFGEIYICGKGLRLDSDYIHKLIGYCPQHLYLFPFMTMSNHLFLLLQVKGVEKKTIARHVRNIINLMNARRYAHKRVEELSYAEKRQVAISLALIGDPQLIVLDEPTWGLSFSDSREIWNVIRLYKFIGKGFIILTRSSMECEMLGGTVMVMENYRMLAYSSISSLKLTYSQALLLELKVGVENEAKADMEANFERDLQNINDFVKFLDDKFVFIRWKGTWVQYKIQLANVQYSRLWGSLEKAKARLGIIEYNLFWDTEEYITDLYFRKRNLMMKPQTKK